MAPLPGAASQQENSDERQVQEETEDRSCQPGTRQARAEFARDEYERRDQEKRISRHLGTMIQKRLIQIFALIWIYWNRAMLTLSKMVEASNIQSRV